jgi:dTDP-4-amino-4,6-dideoxygalactose transaminase
VLTCDRDALEQHLNDNGIEAKRPVYKPAHHYSYDNSPHEVNAPSGQFPMADRAHDEALSIPIHPTLSDEDVQIIIHQVTQFFELKG